MYVPTCLQPWMWGPGPVFGCRFFRGALSGATVEEPGSWHRSEGLGLRASEFWVGMWGALLLGIQQGPDGCRHRNLLGPRGTGGVLAKELDILQELTRMAEELLAAQLCAAVEVEEVGGGHSGLSA